MGWRTASREQNVQVRGLTSTRTPAVGWRAASREHNVQVRGLTPTRTRAMGWRAASRKQKWCGREETPRNLLSPLIPMTFTSALVSLVSNLCSDLKEHDH